jgi:hypothetical protein
MICHQLQEGKVVPVRTSQMDGGRKWFQDEYMSITSESFAGAMSIIAFLLRLRLPLLITTESTPRP